MGSWYWPEKQKGLTTNFQAPWQRMQLKCVGKNVNSGFWWSWFEFYIEPLLSISLWANHFTPLSLNFLKYKTKVIIRLLDRVLKIQWDDSYKVFSSLALVTHWKFTVTISKLRQSVKALFSIVLKSGQWMNMKDKSDGGKEGDFK